MSSETYPRTEGKKRPIKGKLRLGQITGEGLHVDNRSRIENPSKGTKSNGKKLPKTENRFSTGK